MREGSLDLIRSGLAPASVTRMYRGIAGTAVLLLALASCSSGSESERPKASLNKTCIDAETLFANAKSSNDFYGDLRRLLKAGNQESRNALADVVTAVENHPAREASPDSDYSDVTAAIDKLKRRCAAIGSSAFK
jgi:hypothetical protein